MAPLTDDTQLAKGTHRTLDSSENTPSAVIKFPARNSLVIREKPPLYVQYNTRDTYMSFKGTVEMLQKIIYFYICITHDACPLSLPFPANMFFLFIFYMGAGHREEMDQTNDEMLQITPISHLKVTNFNYVRTSPPATSFFITCTHSVTTVPNRHER